ncbi:hypothetical protein [Lactococcus lactis]|uniref:hypothetical protein n=1 Tax=Lactococcus lactis TaxID=1358 RepID=UPI002891AE7F|nr:hypothetical protein [Lactococcus lactis]MDT2898505.1 hypothetical protein [Lactococcus lactis]
MIVKKEQIMRIILEQQSQEIKFRFYSASTIGGLSKTELATYESIIPKGSTSATYESIIPKGSTSATYEHRPDIQFDALALVKSEWQDIAYFSLNGEMICERSAYGEAMISKCDELFTQNAYKQAIEDELKAEKSDREVVVSELTEKGAGGLMSDYATYWEQYKKENNL